MQIIKIASVEVKSGEKDGKPWTRYTITGEDKSSLSTFDKKASTLKAGDTIEAEIELKGKYANIKSFKIMGGEPSLPPLEPPARAVSPPLVVGRSTDDRIAEQVAVKAIVELACYKVIEPNHPLVTAVKSWCSDKLQGYLSMFPTDTPKQEIKPVVTQPENKAIDCGVDMEWLRENCKKIKWSDAVCLSWIEASFKIKRAGTLEGTIALLDSDQKTKLCHFVANAAGK